MTGRSPAQQVNFTPAYPVGYLPLREFCLYFVVDSLVQLPHATNAALDLAEQEAHRVGELLCHLLPLRSLRLLDLQYSVVQLIQRIFAR